jgi:hypothetical protein
MADSRPISDFLSYFTFSFHFLEQMLGFPNGIFDQTSEQPFGQEEFVLRLNKRLDALKNAFLSESSPRPGVPSVVSGYRGKRQQLLAGVDVLVSARQNCQLAQMANTFEEALLEDSMIELSAVQDWELQQVT